MSDSTNTCQCCSSVYQETDVNCLQCGYPLQGTVQQQQNFISERGVKEIELSDLSGKVNAARKSLFIIAGVDAVFGLIMYFGAKGQEDALPNLIAEMLIVSIFVALGLWARKKARPALITGLVVYVSLHLLNAVFEPMSIISGILLKIFIVIYLIKGIKAVSEADQLRKELNLV